MEPRINYANVSTGARKAMFGLGEYLHTTGLEKTLLDLVDLRVSQINGCAYCLDMHWKDLKAAGEPDQNSIRWKHGAKPHFILSASARPWPGRKL